MKVELSKDPLYQIKESPVKDLKKKELERQRKMRIQRMNPQHEKKQLQIEVVDPLTNELKEFKAETSLKKSNNPQKARQNLKKYIIQQQKNLRCLRLQRFTEQKEAEESPKLRGNFNANFMKYNEEKANKEINIPKIQDLFRNQEREYMLYENSVLSKTLTKAKNLIDHRVDNIKNMNYVGKQNLSSNYTKKSFYESEKLPSIYFQNQPPNQQEVEIDQLIQKNLKKSERLQAKLYAEKKEMTSYQTKDKIEQKSLNFFLSIPKKPKKKVMLEGVKSRTFSDGNRKLFLTPASSLLFEMNRLSSGRQKKEHQLTGLLKNSFQNRQSILDEKSNFYDQETPFSDLTPSNQWKLRQLMDQKLVRRLQLSKQQINNFTKYLYEIKNYHVIINDTILDVLKEVRETLLRGKVMKASDLSSILKRKDRTQMKGQINELIVRKLSEMMV